jgi:hypothetical protein
MQKTVRSIDHQAYLLTERKLALEFFQHPLA